MLLKFLILVIMLYKFVEFCNIYYTYLNVYSKGEVHENILIFFTTFVCFLKLIQYGIGYNWYFMF